MIPQKIAAVINRSMHDCIGYIGLGRNRILLHTCRFFPDGDEFRTVLEYKEEGDEYELILTDDGHTAMWLSYEDFEITDSRRDDLRSILNASGAEFDEGEVYIRCDENNAGRALKSLIWTIQQMSDLGFPGRAVVRNAEAERENEPEHSQN